MNLSSDIVSYLNANPYTHATSTAIFAYVPKTDNSLTSVSKVLDADCAPPTGECDQGGLCGLKNDGNTRFARLYDSYWSLNTIWEKYAIGCGKPRVPKLDMKDEIKNTTKRGFANINQLLVKILRSKQLGINPMLSYSPQEREAFVNEVQETFQKILGKNQLIKFIAKFCSCNEKWSFQKNNEIYDWLQQISSEMISSLQNTEDLNSLHKLLKLPDWVTLSEQTKIPADLVDLGNALDLQDRDSYLFNCFSRKCLRDGWLADASEILPQIDALIDDFTQRLQKRVDQLCRHLLDDRIDTKDSEMLKLAESPIPIVLFSHASDAFTPSKYEYVAERPLKFGVDCTLIATNCRDIAKVQQVLAAASIQNVCVIAIESVMDHLRNSKPRTI